MDREPLQGYLDAGLSLERIGELVGKHPSTVGYWVKKHGLANPRTGRYAGKGGLDRERLIAFVEAGLTLREIATATERSLTTVRYWMRRHGLETRYAAWVRDPELKPEVLERAVPTTVPFRFRRMARVTTPVRGARWHALLIVGDGSRRSS